MPDWIEDKVHQFESPRDPTTPTRALGTPFQPDLVNHVLCLYTVEMVCTAGQDVQVELRSDAANPPTVVRCSARYLPTQGGTARQQLTFIAKPGDYVELVKSGTGAASIVHETEIVIP